MPYLVIGGLLNITTNGADPEGQLHIRLDLAPPNYVAVDIPIPGGYISTLDLCDYIQNYFNALNLGGSPGIVTCSYCRFTLNYFNIIITNSQGFRESITVRAVVLGSVDSERQP